jgi:hypothetical protein
MAYRQHSGHPMETTIQQSSKKFFYPLNEQYRVFRCSRRVPTYLNFSVLLLILRISLAYFHSLATNEKEYSHQKEHYARQSSARLL